MIAFTTILHGNEDGSVVTINEGEAVKGLPKEVVDDLKAQGLVGDAPVASEVQEAEADALRARVVELEAELEAAKKVAPPAPTK